MRTSLARITTWCGLVAALAGLSAPVSAAPAPKGPTLVVANPNPGDMVIPGALVMQGVAFDDDAEAGLGVDRVSVFLDDRDKGGLHLGNAVFGGRNVLSSDPQFATAGWSLTTTALKGEGQHRDLVVYARSAVNGAETVVTIPISVGEVGQHASNGAGDEGGPEE
jgi:hypothetical protein